MKYAPILAYDNSALPVRITARKFTWRIHIEVSFVRPEPSYAKSSKFITCISMISSSGRKFKNELLSSATLARATSQMKLTGVDKKLQLSSPNAKYGFRPGLKPFARRDSPLAYSALLKIIFVRSAFYHLCTFFRLCSWVT